MKVCDGSKAKIRRRVAQLLLAVCKQTKRQVLKLSELPENIDGKREQGKVVVP